MEEERDLSEYRARLLDGLEVGARRSACDSSDSIQVFVNERRAGQLDGRVTDATFQLYSDTRIDNVQLRSEDGVLLGGLSGPEYGFRTGRIQLSRDAVELRIHNTAQGGSANVVFVPAPYRWRRLWQTFAGIADTSIGRRAAAVAPGIRMVALTQGLLAIIVLGLAADRITSWLTPERTAPPGIGAEAPWAAPLAEVAKLEQQLGDLARMQAKAADTVQSQQHGMAQLQLAIAKLSSTQETVASGMQAIKLEMERRKKGGGRETTHMTRLLMSKAQMEQEQLEAEIHSLTVANERMAKEMAALTQHNQELEKKLRSAEPDVSKARVLDRDHPVIAQEVEVPQQPSRSQIAEAGGNAQALLFWVNFSDGTTQESIDQWVNEMHGSRGVVNEGWQEVRVMQPPIPTDRFLEQIRGAQIVKAVRVTR
jgi:hypothetical protein